MRSRWGIRIVLGQMCICFMSEEATRQHMSETHGEEGGRAELESDTPRVVPASIADGGRGLAVRDPGTET
jgi:hypothetical protein